ncbi:MAG: hypothetical protein K2H13_08160, partial [Eubacterium sp.]|nr:hypothetical protein [Eubacterium sp.]
VLLDEEYEIFKSNVLANKNIFKQGYSSFETTIMFDNPNPKFTFYSEQVDGRLRLRTSKLHESDIFKTIKLSEYSPTSMITWKQRIPEYANNDIRIEKEIEVHFESSESSQMILILNEILKCPRISSYERIRETFYTNEIEVASDLFPYGHVVELELKSGNESSLLELAELLGLKTMKRSRLSCDDLYKLLCKKASIDSNSDILFSDKAMPKINDYLESIVSYL